MRKKLKRMVDVASALNTTISRAYVLSSQDAAFPPVVERVGNVNFYAPADIARYARTRKSRRRWHR